MRRRHVGRHRRSVQQQLGATYRACRYTVPGCVRSDSRLVPPSRASKSIDPVFPRAAGQGRRFRLDSVQDADAVCAEAGVQHLEMTATVRRPDSQARLALEQLSRPSPSNSSITRYGGTGSSSESSMQSRHLTSSDAGSRAGPDLALEALLRTTSARRGALDQLERRIWCVLSCSARVDAAPCRPRPGRSHAIAGSPRACRRSTPIR